MDQSSKAAEDFLGFIEEVENRRAELFADIYQLIQQNAQETIRQILNDPETSDWLSEQERLYLTSYCAIKGLPSVSLN